MKYDKQEKIEYFKEQIANWEKKQRYYDFYERDYGDIPMENQKEAMNDVASHGDNGLRGTMACLKVFGAAGAYEDEIKLFCKYRYDREILSSHQRECCNNLFNMNLIDLVNGRWVLHNPELARQYDFSPSKPMTTLELVDDPNSSSGKILQEKKS